MKGLCMKSGIHPVYYMDAKVVCSCGNTFTTGSTKEEIRVEVCSKCHPVYTGVKRFLDTLGRVDKFEMARKAAQEKTSKLSVKAYYKRSS